MRFVNKSYLAWTKRPVKILGIYIHPDWETTQAANLTDKIVKIDYILKTWSKRKLTLIGKIVVIESLIISQLAYLFTNLPTPDKHLFKIN